MRPIAILAFLSFLGCAPSPEKVCAKMVEILTAETKDWSDDDKKFMAPRMKSLKEECPKNAAVAKEKDAARYKKAASCVMESKKLDEAMTCDLFGKK